MPDQHRAGRQIAVQHRRIVRAGVMQLAQRTDGAAGKAGPGFRIPRPVFGALRQRRRRRILGGKERHFARVLRRILKGVDDARRPAVLLQPVQRIELAARLALRVRVVACRPVVEVQHHPLLPGSVSAPVDAVEPLGRVGLQLEVGVYAEAPQLAVERHAAPRLQHARRLPYLRSAQHGRGTDPDRSLPRLEPVHGNAADDAGQRRVPLRRVGDQKRARHVREAGGVLTQLPGDPLGL